jgi:GT2 family glycosyltransferase
MRLLWPPQYKMGYFEDTDLAMTVRASGLKVLLQPLAVVYHQEGTTFGTDASSDYKRQLMAENRAKFKRKWGTVLQVRLGPWAGGWGKR